MWPISGVDMRDVSRGSQGHRGIRVQVLAETASYDIRGGVVEGDLAQDLRHHCLDVANYT